MTAKKTITYHPQILNAVSMQSETKEALQKLWDLGQSMCLHGTLLDKNAGWASVSEHFLECVSDGKTHHLAMTRTKTLFQSIPDGESILKDALFQLLTDPMIEELMDSIIGVLPEDDISPEASRKMGFHLPVSHHVTFLPGLVYVTTASSIYFMRRLRDHFDNRDETAIESTLTDLGVFVASEYNSAHEMLEIQALIKKYESVWKPFQDQLMIEQRRNEYTLMKHRLEFGDPVFAHELI